MCDVLSQLSCSVYISHHKNYVRWSKGEDAILFKQLLEFAVKNVSFLYNDKWYVQTDGVSMGSPLVPL